MSNRIETLEFQAEARQLLQLMVHSIYSNKDVFLRELISNASDALDKLRLESLVDKDLAADASDLHIEIEVDREARTLTVRDNGIGMSRDDVVGLIGTIAKSGTAELLAKLRESKDSAGSADLIGQFGVGFYATFMVADRVTLVTRRAGEAEGTRWESTGEGTYVVETIDDAPQGTAVTVHLKPEDSDDNLHDYTVDWKIREIVKRYSDFIAWPIRMTVERPGEDDAVTREVQTVNSMKALWARPRSRSTRRSTRSSTSTSATTGLTPSRRSTCGARGPSSTRPCCSCRRTPRSTCSPRRPVAACSSTSSACSSWTTATR